MVRWCFFIAYYVNDVKLSSVSLVLHFFFLLSNKLFVMFKEVKLFLLLSIAIRKISLASWKAFLC